MAASEENPVVYGVGLLLKIPAILMLIAYYYVRWAKVFQSFIMFRYDLIG